MQNSYAINEYSAGLDHYRRMRNRLIAGAALAVIVCACYQVFA